MDEKVYIGSGKRLERVYGISPHLLIQFIPPQKGIFDYTRYDPTLDKILEPKSVFIVQEGMDHKLRGHLSSKGKPFDLDKAKVLEPSYDPLREYLSNEAGDKVIVTNEGLVDKLDLAIRQLGFNTVQFSI